MLIFQPEELTKSEHTLFYNLLLSSSSLLSPLCSPLLVLYASVRLVSALGLLGVYSMLQE